MSNKRVIAREEKRKKKLVRQWAIAITCVVVIAIAGVFTVYGINQYNNSFIMTFEGEKIGVADYRFSTIASAGAEDEKAQGLEQLLQSLTILHHAEAENITLTEEEEESLNSVASGFNANMSQAYGMDFSFIGVDRIKALLSADNFYSHLLEKHTADYVVDEADFATSLADYKENGKHLYYNIGLKYIFTETQEAMDEVVTNLETRPFDDVLKEFSIYYTEGTEITPAEIKNMTLPEEVSDEILGLKVGERTVSHEIDGAFAIFEVVSYSIPAQAEVEETYREQYIAEQKSLIFTEILDGWVEEADYTLNQAVYDNYEV